MLEDSPLLPMPELLQRGERYAYTVRWQITGTLTVFAADAAEAQLKAERNSETRLVLLSDETNLEMDEPKEKAGE